VSRERFAQVAVASPLQLSPTMVLLRPIPRALPLRAPRPFASRHSSTSTSMRYGFVGLGQMGYPMAMNLLRKTNTPQSTFTIYDVNPLSLSRFVNESTTIEGAPQVIVAKTPKELAERSVCLWITDDGG
jgi:NAD binding domain of 6-phosphogluconate dehydrogenase